MLRSLFLILVSIFLLTGCGGGGSSSDSTSNPSPNPQETGVFIDDVVEGIKYINEGSSEEKFTNTNGEFTYDGGKVSFYIGTIKIGEISSLASDKKVFIQDILNLERTNVSDAKALKIAKLIQSLDSEPTSDKIKIKKSDFDKFNNINKDVEDIDLSKVLQDSGIVAKSDDEVKRHLQNVSKRYDITTDTDAPTIKSISPANSSSDIAINSDIIVTFSEDIPKSSLSKENIELKTTDGTKIPFSIIHKLDELIINPTNDLAYNTEYRLTLKNSIKDYAKNKIVNDGGNTDIVISFTTADVPDTTKPTVTITDDESAIATSTDPITFTFTWSEEVTGFTIDDVVVTGGTKGTFSGSETTYTLIITPNNNLDASITVNIAANKLSDNAGNSNDAITQYTQAVHADKPTVIISDSEQGIAKTTDAITFTFTWSEIVTGFTEDDIKVTGGTKGTFSENGEIYTLDITPNDNFDADITVDIAASKVLDSEGNENDAIAQYTQAVDTLTSISHNGYEYKVIVSPITGRKWLDRNLGATEVCTSGREDFSSDEDYENSQESCFGDYYQWGRLTDGHEKKDSEFKNSYSDRAEDISNAGKYFILNSFDWVSNRKDRDGISRSAQWKKTDGTSVCPIGFQVPTRDRLEAETTHNSIQDIDEDGDGNIEIINIDTAFKNFLKIPSSGYVLNSNASFYGFGTYGALWSRSISDFMDNPIYMSFQSDGADVYRTQPSMGYPVRCVKD
ncbi:MAG: hypothetical protein GY932_02950 [Arcobacter sp.]|nr:hypothetical protein [Arcobacter sp.]